MATERLNPQIQELLSKDTPPRGVEIDFETGLARMQALEADPRLVDFIRNNPLYPPPDERRVFFHKRTETGSDQSLHYDVRVLDGSDKDLKAVFAWQVIHGKRSSKRNFWIGFFTQEAWAISLEHAELQTQLKEPNPHIQSGESFWQQLKDLRHGFQPLTRHIHAVPRLEDLLPVVAIVPDTATAYISVRYQEGEQGIIPHEITDSLHTPEAQVIKPLVLSYRQALEQAIATASS